MGANFIKLPSLEMLGWIPSDGIVSSGIDTGLSRQGVGLLALTNVASLTTATSFRVYNTTDSATSPTNYERGVLDWTTNSNILTIGTQNGGTGSTVAIECVI